MAQVAAREQWATEEQQLEQRPRFRVVEPSPAERRHPAHDEPDVETLARSAYIKRLETSPDRPELDPRARVLGVRRGEPAPAVTLPRTGMTRRVRGKPPAPAANLASRPDRIALWAVVLGLFLSAMAVATARADTPPEPAGDSVPVTALVR